MASERAGEGQLKAVPGVRNTGLEEDSPHFLCTGIGVLGSLHPKKKRPSCGLQPCATVCTRAALMLSVVRRARKDLAALFL